MKIKKILFSFLLVIAISCFCGGTVSVLATENTVPVTKIEVAGASMRITENDTGLRFLMKIGDEDYDKDSIYGAIIVPKDYVTETALSEIEASGGDWLSYFDNTSKLKMRLLFENITPSQQLYEGGNTIWTIKASIVGIKYFNLNREFTAVPYAEKNGVKTWFYDNTFTRNANYIANCAISDVNNSEEQNTILKNYIEKGKYSALGYTEEEYNGFVATPDTAPEITYETLVNGQSGSLFAVNPTDNIDIGIKLVSGEKSAVLTPVVKQNDNGVRVSKGKIGFTDKFSVSDISVMYDGTEKGNVKFYTNYAPMRILDVSQVNGAPLSDYAYIEDTAIDPTVTADIKGYTTDGNCVRKIINSAWSGVNLHFNSMPTKIDNKNLVVKIHLFNGNGSNKTLNYGFNNSKDNLLDIGKLVGTLNVREGWQTFEFRKGFADWTDSTIDMSSIAFLLRGGTAETIYIGGIEFYYEEYREHILLNEVTQAGTVNSNGYFELIIKDWFTADILTDIDKFAPDRNTLLYANLEAWKGININLPDVPTTLNGKKLSVKMTLYSPVDTTFYYGYNVAGDVSHGVATSQPTKNIVTGWQEIEFTETEWASANLSSLYMYCGGNTGSGASYIGSITFIYK